MKDSTKEYLAEVFGTSFLVNSTEIEIIEALVNKLKDSKRVMFIGMDFASDESDKYAEILMSKESVPIVIGARGSIGKSSHISRALAIAHTMGLSTCSENVEIEFSSEGIRKDLDKAIENLSSKKIDFAIPEIKFVEHLNHSTNPHSREKSRYASRKWRGGKK